MDARRPNDKITLNKEKPDIEEHKNKFQRGTSSDDWVWVKEKAFSVKEENVPSFLVQWNDKDCMFAVTSRYHSRVAQDEDETTKTGAFSLKAINSIHNTLQGIDPTVRKLPRRLPREPKGLKGMFVGLRMPSDMEHVCSDLQIYFAEVATKVGTNLMNEVMFEAAAMNMENYFEQISEVNKQELWKKISISEDELKNIAFEREQCTVMRDLEDVYQREDEAVERFLTALANYYNHQLQPYLDTEILAKKMVQSASEKLTNPDIGNRIKAEHQEEHFYWACLLFQAEEIIQKFYVEHQTLVVAVFQELIEQISFDKNRFGPNAYDLVGARRELVLYKELHSAKVKLLQSKRKQLRQEKDKISLQIPDDNTLENTSTLKELQCKRDSKQSKVFNTELEILVHKRKEINCKIEIRKREIADEKGSDDMKFHDALESLENISDEDDPDPETTDNELLELKKERVKVSQLQAKINVKKKHYLGSISSKLKEEEDEERRQQEHHKIQKKRETQKDAEQRTSSFAFEERKKTIERLKEFKIKYATPPTIKPSRYQSRKEKQNNSAASRLNKQTTPKKTANVSQSKNTSATKVKGDPKSSPVKPWQQKKKGKKAEDIPVTIHTGKPLDQNTNNSADTAQGPPATAPPPPPPPPLLPPPLPPLLPNATSASVKPDRAPVDDTKGLSLADIAGGLSRLKKTEPAADDSSNAAGHIDLGSLLASKAKLKPASERPDRPQLEKKDPFTDIFSMIRSGVALKKLDNCGDRSSKSFHVSNQMTKSAVEFDARNLLQSTLFNRRRGVRGDSPDSDEEDCSENDEFDDV